MNNLYGIDTTFVLNLNILQGKSGARGCVCIVVAASTNSIHCP